MLTGISTLSPNGKPNDTGRMSVRSRRRSSLSRRSARASQVPPTQIQLSFLPADRHHRYDRRPSLRRTGDVAGVPGEVDSVLHQRRPVDLHVPAWKTSTAVSVASAAAALAGLARMIPRCGRKPAAGPWNSESWPSTYSGFS